MTKKNITVYSIIGLSLAVTLMSCNSQAEDRKAVMAGSWYPGTEKSLAAAVNEYLKEAGPIQVKGRPIGVIAPHAGYQWSGRAAGSAFRPLEGWKIKRVILMGPSHRYPLRGISVDAFENYVTPLGKVAVDREACSALLKKPLFKWEAAASLNEHSLEIELPFLQVVLGKFELIPIVVGEIDEREVVEIAKELKKFMDDGTLVVASSDFTHYGMAFGYMPFKKDIRKNIESLDKGAVDLIIKKNLPSFTSYLRETGATICGRNPIALIMEMMPKEARGYLLNYYTSGDLTRDFSHSVSYAAIVFTIESKK